MASQGFFNNPNRASSSMGRGRMVNYDLDDATGFLQQGCSGFKTKAKTGADTIFIPIFPGPIRTPDGEFTDFFRAVQVGEFGREKNFTNFIANPADREIEYPDIPVIALCREFKNGIDRNDPAFLPAMPFFMPRGQYNQPDFKWPATWIVFQCAVYRQPALSDPKILETLKGQVKQLADGTWVFSEPQFKMVFLKGTGRDAITERFSACDPQGNFQVPVEFCAGGAPVGFRTGFRKGEDDKSEMTLDFYDLSANGLRPPTQDEVIKNWKPWEKVFRKISYAEQMQKCVKYFGLPLVSQVFPDAAAIVGMGGAPMSPAGQQAAPPAGAGGAATWAAAPPVAPAPAVVRTFQQPAAPAAPAAPPAAAAAAAPAPAAGGATWGAPPQQPAADPAAPQQQAAAPAPQPQQVAPAQPAAAAAAVVPPAQVPPVAAVAPQAGAAPMTAAEMTARFQTYRNGAPAPQ